MTAYYNEWDKYAARVLEARIAEGRLPAGDVDTRSIKEVMPDDLKGYSEVHFFAGIGGWPLALALAGWSGPVWTGSCPCQPFSAAGKGKGEDDERHLWPEFRRLIAECRPATVFGEQVASPAGKDWLSGVRFDLETLGYAVGAADLCAAGAGTPHIRQRLWWVADCNSARHTPVQRGVAAEVYQGGTGGRPFSGSECGGSDGGLGDTQSAEARAGDNLRTGQSYTGDAGAVGFWSNYDLIPCADGKTRRVESGTFPLAHGVSSRVGKLRCYGNAIEIHIAGEFVAAYKDTLRGDQI